MADMLLLVDDASMLLLVDDTSTLIIEDPPVVEVSGSTLDWTIENKVHFGVSPRKLHYSIRG